MEVGEYRIMVIDDEPDVALAMTESIAALTGYKVTAFTDPYRALQGYLKKAYHLVLTDITMPNINGYELIKCMREQATAGEFIVVTAHKRRDVVYNARRVGASYLFFKPVNMETLLDAIETMKKRHDYWMSRLAEVDNEIDA